MPFTFIPISKRNSFFEDPIFQKHHQDFREMKLQMLKEAKEFFSKVDEELDQMEHCKLGLILGSRLDKSTYFVLRTI